MVMCKICQINNSLPLGLVTCALTFGVQTFNHDFIVCKNLTKLIIIGTGIQQLSGTISDWTPDKHTYVTKTKSPFCK